MLLTHEQAILNAERALNKLVKKHTRAEYKPQWHFSAKRGWINDPNGLIFFKGYYHLFYQFNPYKPIWGAMHWGHAISRDLINWEHLPIALAPSEVYDNYEKGGCFSGCAVDDNGILTLLYTGVAYNQGKIVQSQCLALSEDGIHFEKYEGNPVIAGPPESGSDAFRDPKVWLHENIWYMVIGTSKDGLGKALLYKSLDLKKWEYINVLCESRGEFGSMWECPDFFELNGKHVLTFSPVGVGYRKAVYLVGDMDYKTGRFHYQSIGEIDWGFDYYAPQTMLDNKGRRIIIAWANSWDWMPWWKGYSPAISEGWCGSLSFPREVKLCTDGKLQFIPVEEYKLLRVGHSKKVKAKVYGETEVSLPASGELCFEMFLEVDVSISKANKIEIGLKVASSKKTLVICDLGKADLILNRNNSDGWSTGENRCPLEVSSEKIIRLHIFVDRSYIEIYTDNYRTVISGNVYAGDCATGSYLKVYGGDAYIEGFSYILKPIPHSRLAQT